MMLNDTILYPNVNNWASRVQRILKNLAFTIVWLNQGVGCPKAFLKGFSQRVRDNLMQTWQTELNHSTRGSTYIMFSEFGFNRYLDIILVAKYRYAFTKLRTSSHRLAIETGRWTKIS